MNTVTQNNFLILLATIGTIVISYFTYKEIAGANDIEKGKIDSALIATLQCPEFRKHKHICKKGMLYFVQRVPKEYLGNSKFGDWFRMNLNKHGAQSQIPNVYIKKFCQDVDDSYKLNDSESFSISSSMIYIIENLNTIQLAYINENFKNTVNDEIDDDLFYFIEIMSYYLDKHHEEQWGSVKSKYFTMKHNKMEAEFQKVIHGLPNEDATGSRLTLHMVRQRRQTQIQREGRL